MVVLPALSSPRISTRTSLRPKRELNMEEKKTPMLQAGRAAFVKGGLAALSDARRDGACAQVRMKEGLGCAQRCTPPEG